MTTIENLVYSGKKMTTSSFVTKIKRAGNIASGLVKFNHKPLERILIMIEIILKTKNPVGLLYGLKGLWLILLTEATTGNIVWICNARENDATIITKHMSTKDAASHCNKIIGRQTISTSKVSYDIRARKNGGGPNFFHYSGGYFTFHKERQRPGAPEVDGVCYMSPWVSEDKRFELWYNWTKSM